MLADAGLMPRRTPGWPLAVTLGVHLLLAWWWLQATSVRVLPNAAPAQREFILVAVLAPAAPASAPAPSSRPPSQPASASPTSAARSSARTAPATATPPAPAVLPGAPQPMAAAPDPSADAAPAASANDSTADPLATAPTAGTMSARDGMRADDDSLAGRGKRTAGTVDHDLRKGKLAPLDPSDSKWHRFALAVGNARVDTSRTLTSESYTSPDGVVVYRFRQGGRTWCRTGGDIRPSPFGAQGGGAQLFDKAGGGGFAGTVACPSGVQFKPD